MSLISRILKSGPEPGWLAVVMRERRVDLARVRRRPAGRPLVDLAESVELGGSPATTLGRLRASLGLARQRCSALLQHGSYQFIATEAVAGPVDEVREMLRWKLKDQVDFPVESAAVDILPIPSDGRAAQVFAALAPESSVVPLVHAFQDARLQLEAIDLPEISQRNLARLYEDADRGLAMLVFDDTEGLLTFTQNGELLVVRHVEISAGQLLAADAGRREALFERIALDVQRSLDNFDRNYSSVPLQRLLVAAIPGLDEFFDYLRANLTIAVDVLDLNAVLDFGPAANLRDPLRAFQALRAIGAALRDEVPRA